METGIMTQYPLKFFNLIATFTLVFMTGMSINIQPVFADDTDIYEVIRIISIRYDHQ